MWQPLHDAWWRLATQSHPRSFSDILASRVLQSASLVYRAGVAARNAAYARGWLRQVRLPCRVVSVGNLTLGGTGKTACVELLARKLLARGRRIAVLSRGYGGRSREYRLRWASGRLQVDGAAAAGLADEPQMLARHLEGVPVVVGRRRDRTGAMAYAELGAEVLILDDGFQHRRLARDCDVVLIHARTPLGGWALFPRGPMREPVQALRRAQVVIITKADEALETVQALRERVRAYSPEAALLLAGHEPSALLDPGRDAQRPLGDLEGRRVGLVSSIGDPDGFEATIRRLGGQVAWHARFPDHHRYTAGDRSAVAARASATAPEAIVTTEKDWVRLQPWVAGPAPLWVLAVRMKILQGEEELDARLAGL